MNFLKRFSCFEKWYPSFALPSYQTYPACGLRTKMCGESGIDNMGTRAKFWAEWELSVDDRMWLSYRVCLLRGRRSAEILGADWSRAHNTGLWLVHHTWVCAGNMMGGLGTGVIIMTWVTAADHRLWWPEIGVGRISVNTDYMYVTVSKPKIMLNSWKIFKVDAIASLVILH